MLDSPVDKIQLEVHVKVVYNVCVHFSRKIRLHFTITGGDMAQVMFDLDQKYGSIAEKIDVTAKGHDENGNVFNVHKVDGELLVAPADADVPDKLYMDLADFSTFSV